MIRYRLFLQAVLTVMYNADYLLRGTIKKFCLPDLGFWITMQSASGPFLNVLADLHECVYPSNGRHPNAIFSKRPLINNNMAEARTRELVSPEIIFRF